MRCWLNLGCVLKYPLSKLSNYDEDVGWVVLVLHLERSQWALLVGEGGHNWRNTGKYKYNTHTQWILKVKINKKCTTTHKRNIGKRHNSCVFYLIWSQKGSNCVYLARYCNSESNSKLVLYFRQTIVCISECEGLWQWEWMIEKYFCNPSNVIKRTLQTVSIGNVMGWLYDHSRLLPHPKEHSL